MISLQLYNWISIFLTILSAVTLTLVFKRDLLMLQLNSYRNERYTRWFNSSQESTSTLRIISCIALFVLLVNSFHFISAAALSAIAQIWIICKLLTAKYKKPLVVTPRVKRIFLTMSVISALIAVVTGVLSHSVFYSAVALLAIAVVSPLILLSANWILKPVEKHINKKYYDEAADILASMPSLKVIGITGSYGKTSTKHYLHRILSEKFDVTMTPGSFNTTLGVIRTIREHLKPYNEVFIVEMGAKQSGDIKEICDLVHPSIGIVTAVGPQHLESFKTIENVQRTKFELIDSLPADGLAVVNNDFPYIANRIVENVETVRYAAEDVKDAQCVISDIEVSHSGTTFTLRYNGKDLRFHTRLVGRCNISNLAAAIVVAINLGVDIRHIAYAVERIEQVEHRLNMKHTPAGITIIDDAFNSNPTGSAMAMEVLGSLSSGRRIVVTPGMIELGDEQYQLNYEFGRTFPGNCDMAIVVGNYNREPIVKGAIDAGMDPDNIIDVDSFTQAQQKLATILRSGDAVLYENDLPDTFK